MNICVASGKGGTGKTTLSVNMAVSLAQSGLPVQLVDCDVEEPNCHLFLNQEWHSEEPVNLLVPVVNEDRCTACGKCHEVCEYSALACVKGNEREKFKTNGCSFKP